VEKYIVLLIFRAVSYQPSLSVHTRANPKIYLPGTVGSLA